ncbi:MAG: cytochrome P450 [Massilia sp.]
MNPSNAIAAVSHADPYPYYRSLLAGPPLVFDETINVWIACLPSVIDEVMANAHCLVRPPAEAVPHAIAGSSAGTIFGHLVRMNEGPSHAAHRRALANALASVDLAAVGARTNYFAAALAASHDLDAWTFALPTYVVADLLGMPEAELPQLSAWMGDFVRALSPLSTSSQLDDASVAAQALLERLASIKASGLMARVAEQTEWRDRQAMLANVIGLLSQTHEATAGLIGNCIVALLKKPELQTRLRAQPQLADDLVREVARCDPSVHNTRRFVAQATEVAGVPLQAGDTILLVLAAASMEGRNYGFGHGRHACPGQELALTIATKAVEHLLGRAHAMEGHGWTYAPSANARLPRFFSLLSKE